jgi:dihydroxyacetone kinase-like protein
MQRGFAAVLADLDKIAAQPLPKALHAVGTTLVMKVGGASGPLYGTLFMQLGKSLPEQPTPAQLADAFAAAVDAVKARGKSDAGCKTMLDVLVPVLAALRDGGDLPRRLPAVADAAAQATVPMRAVRGRASFLGDRSIGHLDPGARSSALIVRAACAVLEGGA